MKRKLPFVIATLCLTSSAWTYGSHFGPTPEKRGVNQGSFYEQFVASSFGLRRTEQGLSRIGGINSATFETHEDIHHFFAVQEAEILAGRNLLQKSRLFKTLAERTGTEFRILIGELGELYEALDDYPAAGDEHDHTESRQAIYDQIHEMTVAGSPWGDYNGAFEWPLEILRFETGPKFISTEEDPCSDYSMSEFVRSYIRTEPDGTPLGPHALMAIRLAEDFCRELRPEQANSINWPTHPFKINKRD